MIVSFRCADLLRDCLRSLEAQRDEVAMEVLVVDNASGDDTPAVAAEFDSVEFEPLDENVGFARANNRAISRASGRALLVLNPDTVLPPGSLRACLDELWRHPDVGVLTPRLVDRAGRLDRRCKRGFPTLWSSFCYFSGLDLRLRGPRSTRYTAGHVPQTQAGDVEAVSGAFMLMPAHALAEVGAFDERFFMYAEDIDLCLRFIAAGWRVRYWPGVDVVHVGAGSSVEGRRPPAADAAYFDTMAPFIRKHRPGVRGLGLSALVWTIARAAYAASRLGRGLGERRGSAAAADEGGDATP